MPCKVQSSFGYIGQELYQLGVHTRAKKKKESVSEVVTHVIVFIPVLLLQFQEQIL